MWPGRTHSAGASQKQLPSARRQHKIRVLFSSSLLSLIHARSWRVSVMEQGEVCSQNEREREVENCGMWHAENQLVGRPDTNVNVSDAERVPFTPESELLARHPRAAKNVCLAVDMQITTAGRCRPRMCCEGGRRAETPAVNFSSMRLIGTRQHVLPFETRRINEILDA